MTDMGMGLGQNAGTMLSHLLFDGTDGCSFDLFRCSYQYCCAVQYPAQ